MNALLKFKIIFASKRKVHTLKKYIQLVWKETISLFSEMRPKSKAETSVLAVSLCVYLPIVLFLVIQTDLMWNITVHNDIIFGFDSEVSMRALTSFTEMWRLSFKHPLMSLIFLPFKLVGYFFYLLAGENGRFYFLILLFPVLVSFVNVFVFRYLHAIARISLQRALLLTFFFAFFATNLTLSFVPESYPFSFFFISFVLVFFSGLILNRQEIPFSQLLILSCFTGGVTCTNVVKCFIPKLFSSFDLRTFLKRIIIVLIIFACIFGIFLIKRDRADWMHSFDVAFDNQPEGVTVKLNQMFSYFWSAPFVWGDFHAKFYDDGPVRLGLLKYSNFSDYIFGTVMLLLCILSGWLNKKNKFVHILLLFFAVDFFITCVLQYGVSEGFIYGGHWVFIVPMLLGWMYQGLKNKRQKIIFDVVMTGMFVSLLINNTYRMFQIFDFALKYYPA